MIKWLRLTACTIIVLMFIFGCGDDEDEAELPTTGTISGTITFVGEPPEGELEIQISIFSVVDPTTGMPAGPPDHYSEPLTQHTGQVPYEILGVSFGEYKLVAVGYELVGAPAGTPETVLGMYGFSAPADMIPDSVTISEDQPDAVGIDITAVYTTEEQSQ